MYSLLNIIDSKPTPHPTGQRSENSSGFGFVTPVEWSAARPAERKRIEKHRRFGKANGCSITNLKEGRKEENKSLLYTHLVYSDCGGNLKGQVRADCYPPFQTNTTPSVHQCPPSQSPHHW